MDNIENNSSIQHTKKFSVESIPAEEVDVPVIEIEKSDTFYANNAEEELPKEDFYFGYADGPADEDVDDEGVVEVDIKKLILIIVAIILAIGLVVLGIIFIPKLINNNEPTGTPDDAHWSAPITDSILSSSQYGVLSVIGSEDNLDQFITGEQFYQLGLRLIEGNPETWGSSDYLRSNLTVARIDAVDAFTSIYDNPDREKMYMLTSFTSADFPGYTASATNNLTIAESLVFMYRLVTSPDFGFGPNGPLYALPTATDTPAPTEAPTATPTLPPVETTEAPIVTTEAPTATPEPTPTPTPTPTVPDDDLTQPIIDISTTEMTNQDVTVTFRFPSWAKEMQYNVDDLPMWADTQHNAVREISTNSKITIRCKQEGSDEWLSYSITIANIDKDAPTFNYDAPEEIAKSVEISVFVQDNLSGIELVKWAKGDHAASYFSNQGTQLNSNGVSQYTFTVNENGTYTIYAKDLAGNATTHVVHVDNIDITPPSIIANLDTYVKENWNNAPVSFTVNISDANLTEAYYVDGGTRYNIPITDGTVSEHSITISTQSANTLVIFTARDAVGNERSLTIYLKIDLVNPVLPQVTSEEMLSDGSVRFKLENASDALSGLDRIEVKPFGGAVLTPDADGYYTVSASGTPVIVTVYDKAGNSVSDGYTIVAEAHTPTPTPEEEPTPTPTPSVDPVNE